MMVMSKQTSKTTKEWIMQAHSRRRVEKKKVVAAGAAVAATATVCLFIPSTSY